MCCTAFTGTLQKEGEKKQKKTSLKLGSLSGVGFEDTKPRMTAKQEKKKSLDIFHHRKSDKQGNYLCDSVRNR